MHIYVDPQSVYRSMNGKCNMGGHYSSTAACDKINIDKD